MTRNAHEMEGISRRHSDTDLSIGNAISAVRREEIAREMRRVGFISIDAAHCAIFSFPRHSFGEDCGGRRVFSDARISESSRNPHEEGIIDSVHWRMHPGSVDCV